MLSGRRAANGPPVLRGNNQDMRGRHGESHHGGNRLRPGIGYGTRHDRCRRAWGQIRDVDIKRVDTPYTPVDPGSYGSRVTLLAGQATQFAARDAKKQLLEAGAKAWQVKTDDIEIRNAIVSLKTNPDKQMSFEKLAKIACYEGSGAVILGRGHSDYGLDPLDFDTGTGNGGTSYSFTSQTTRLGVDMETGKIDVTDFTIAHDAGVPLHPVSVESQNEGGAMQGLGQSIYEGFVMENGRPQTAPSLTTRCRALRIFPI